MRESSRRRARAIDERRRAARVLDRLLPAAPRRRDTSTFGLTRAELRAHRAVLLTAGGVSVRPDTPWTPGEVAAVLDVRGEYR